MMETSKLKKFAQHARRLLLEQVGAKLALVLDASSGARRENPQAVAQLEKQIAATSREQLDDLYRALSSHPMVKVVL